MGLGLFRGRQRADAALRDRQRKFEKVFPSAFAYAYANLGDEESAREVVAEGFARVFIDVPEFDGALLRIALFTCLLELCRQRKRAVPLDIGITPAERDVVTLTFDAGLKSDEVAAVLGTDSAPVALIRALRKMQAAARPPIPSFFRLG